jgi:hypothetical protein
MGLAAEFLDDLPHGTAYSSMIRSASSERSSLVAGVSLFGFGATGGGFMPSTDNGSPEDH